MNEAESFCHLISLRQRYETPSSGVVLKHLGFLVDSCFLKIPLVEDSLSRGESGRQKEMRQRRASFRNKSV